MRNRQQLLTVQTLPIDKPIVQYVRQSTRKQLRTNRVSGEMQDQDMRNILLAHGWKPELILEAIADDTGKSGTKRKDQRKGLQRLYELIETGQVGAIAAFNVSRIYRTLSMAETGLFCDLVMERGIPIITKRRIYWPTRDDNKDLQADFQASADYIQDHVLGTMVAARDYNVAENGAYGGNALPVGFQIVEDENGVKKYAEYTPHAEKIRWLFRRYRERNGNLPLLHRDLEAMNFRFPPLEPGVFAPLKLEQDADGYYLLSNRDSIVYVLTNRAYIGTYEYGETSIKNAHDVIVPMDDFMFAYERLSPVDLDGNERKKKVTERRYGGSKALLDGVLRCGNLPVYTFDNRYIAQDANDGWIRALLAVEVSDIDAAFTACFLVILSRLNHSDNAEQRQQLQQKIEQARIQQQKAAAEFSKTLARIDQEIANARMAQHNCQKLGDAFGHEEATKQVVQLQRDRVAVEIKARHADKEASELKKCHDLIDKACRDWCGMEVEEKKRLIKLMMPVADISAPSPHFIRLRCFFGTPYNRTMDILIYRKDGSRHIWTTEEETTLRQVFSNSSKDQIMAALPICSWTGIEQRARKLGLRSINPSTPEKHPLTHNDLIFMAQTGAKVDEVVWYMIQETGRILYNS